MTGKICDCCPKICACNEKLKLDFGRRSTFIAAAGFLSAILLVWTQLWPLLLTIVPEHVPPQVLREISGNIEVGLAWTYGALLLAVLSFALSIAAPSKSDKSDILNQSASRYRFAISFFELSLLMGLVAVAQSLVSVSLKLYKDTPFWQPSYNLAALGPWLWLAFGAFIVFAMLHICNRLQCPDCACFRVLFMAKWLSLVVFMVACLYYAATHYHAATHLV